MVESVVIFVTLHCLATACYNIGSMHGYAEAMRDVEKILGKIAKEAIEKAKRQEDA